MRRRQAINLAHAIGAEEMGKSLLVPRANLLSFLKAAATGHDYEIDEHRRGRVREAILEAQRQLDARRVEPRSRWPFAPSLISPRA